MWNWLQTLKNMLFFRPVHEALVAYVQKLPDNVRVSWVRDGKFIVGEVEAGSHKFKTQAHSASEFIMMVNSAILAVHEIPEDYSELVARFKVYTPRPEEFKKLDDAAIKKSSFSSARNEKEVLAAA